MAAAQDRLTDPAAKTHWHSCADCSQSVEEWRATCAELAPIQASHAASAKSPCPSTEELFSFSVGVEPPNGPIAAHLMECGRCAAIVRETADPGTDDPTIPLILKTSTPQWQRAMAEKLATANSVNPPIPTRARMSSTLKIASVRPPVDPLTQPFEERTVLYPTASPKNQDTPPEWTPPSEPRLLNAKMFPSGLSQPSNIPPSNQSEPSSKVIPPSSNRPNYWYIAVAAGVAMIIASSLWLRSNHFSMATAPVFRQSNDASQLLAQAYSAQRPFEYRLPDAGYAPIRQQRGAGSAFDHPQSLYEAQSQIQKELSSDKDNPTLLALEGRAQLLQGDTAGAIESLTRAKNARPEDPQIMADLACAYAVFGDTANRNSDYQQSLFNLAIIYERLSLPNQALETWKKFIAEENFLGWQDEAKQHIADIEKRKTKN